MPDSVDDMGFIVIHRKILNSRVWVNDGLFKLWMWCLLKANHKSIWVPIKTGRGESEVLVQRGQFVFGRKSAAKQLKVKETTLWARIKKLERMECITVKSSSTHSIIEICNYEHYQSNEQQNDTLNQKRANFSTPIMTPKKEQKAPKNQGQRPMLLIDDDTNNDSQMTAIRQPNDTNNNDNKKNIKSTSARPNGWTLVPDELVKPLDAVCQFLKSTEHGAALFPDVYKFVGQALKQGKRPDAIHGVLGSIERIRPVDAWAYGVKALGLEVARRNAREFEANHEAMKQEKPKQKRRSIPNGLKKVPVV